MPPPYARFVAIPLLVIPILIYVLRREVDQDIPEGVDRSAWEDRAGGQAALLFVGASLIGVVGVIAATIASIAIPGGPRPRTVGRSGLPNPAQTTGQHPFARGPVGAVAAGPSENPTRRRTHVAPELAQRYVSGATCKVAMSDRSP